MADELTLDAWAGISHKRGLSGKAIRGWQAPTWVGDHQRRLTAYVILQAYLDNCARHFAAVDSPAAKSERREYGDAALLVVGYVFLCLIARLLQPAWAAHDSL